MIRLLHLLVVKMTNHSSNMLTKERELVLANIFYNVSHPSGFSSVAKLFRAAKLVDSTIKKDDVTEWLRRQETYAVHRPARKNISGRKTVVSRPLIQWQLDLVDMSKYRSHNSNFTFLLTGVDVFSRFAFALPLKNKRGDTVASAIKEIFVSTGQAPKYCQSDAGKEFLNANVIKVLDEYNVKLFSVHSSKKSALVERFNRTLRSRMHKVFTAKNTRRYVDILQDLISAYNHSIHRSLGAAPIVVHKAKDVRKYWDKMYRNEFPLIAKFKFDIGDKAKISKYKKVFDKGYLPQWTSEFFIIEHRMATKPVTYKIKDLNSEIIRGTFYESELQLVTPTNDYKIDILKTRKRNGRPYQYFVHYRGWPSSHDQWVDITQVRSLKN